MSYLSRFIPDSNILRNQVLTDAFNQKTAVGPGGDIFTPATSNRLDNIQPSFKIKLDDVRVQEEALGNLTTLKGEVTGKLHMHCSHFIQVFNFAVERGVFTKDDRLYYGLDKETGKLPPMDTEDDLKDVAQQLISGEANRIAAGGAPMSNPSIADIVPINTSFNQLVTDHQTAALKLIITQNKLDELVIEADKVIKKIYDEAEANYNELEPATQREACRQWGVIYQTVGDNTLVTIQVKQADGTPATGVEVKLVEASGKKLITDAAGEVVFDTKVVGPATIEVRLIPGSKAKPNAEQKITIQETIPMTVVIQL